MNMSITTLPVEIITQICDVLDLKDWCSLRLACKRLHAGSIEAFAHRYYKRVNFFITSDALRRVEEIAAHDILRTRVQELWIAPCLFDKVDRGNLSGKSPRSLLRQKDIKENSKVEARYVTWEAIVADNRDIFESPTLVEFLERCVARFENVVTVGLRSRRGIYRIIDPRDDLDFDCLGADEIRARLYPLGKHTMFFGREMNLHDETIVFSIVMNAMIKYKRKIKALHADSLRPEVFHPPYQQQGLLHFRGLETLDMILYFHRFDDRNSTGYQALLDLVHVVAPALKSLKFSQQQFQYELGANGFDQISRRVEFSQLHELHLRYTEVTVRSLKTFLHTAWPTLRKLTLEDVCLCDKLTPENDPGPRKDHKASSYLKDISSGAKDEIRALWKDLLEFFRQQLSLHFLVLDCLGYRGRAMSTIDWSKHTPQSLNFSRGLKDERMYARFDADQSDISFDAWIRLVSIDFDLPYMHNHLPGSDYYEPTPEDLADEDKDNGPFPQEIFFRALTRQEYLEQKAATAGRMS